MLQSKVKGSSVVASAKRVKMGRPPKPREERRMKRTVVMLTEQEFAQVEAMADERGLPIGTVLYEQIARWLKRAK